MDLKCCASQRFGLIRNTTSSLSAFWNLCCVFKRLLKTMVSCCKKCFWPQFSLKSTFSHVSAVPLIAMLWWNAGQSLGALTHFSKGSLSFQASHNDLSLTRVHMKLIGCWVFMPECVSVSGCTRPFCRGGVGVGMTQWDRRLPVINLCQA